MERRRHAPVHNPLHEDIDDERDIDLGSGQSFVFGYLIPFLSPPPMPTSVANKRPAVRGDSVWKPSSKGRLKSPRITLALGGAALASVARRRDVAAEQVSEHVRE